MTRKVAGVVIAMLCVVFLAAGGVAGDLPMSTRHDAIRDHLAKQGIVLEDRAESTIWRRQ